MDADGRAERGRGRPERLEPRVVELERAGARRDLDSAQAEPVRALELARARSGILQRHRGERREALGVPPRDRGQRVVVHLRDREREVGRRVGVEHERGARERLHVDAQAIHVGEPRGRVAHARVERPHGAAADVREAPLRPLDDARVEPRALAREERDDLLGHDVVVEIDDTVLRHCHTPNTRKPVETHDARNQVTSSLRSPMAPAPMIQLRSSWSPFASISGLS